MITQGLRGAIAFSLAIATDSPNAAAIRTSMCHLVWCVVLIFYSHIGICTFHVVCYGMRYITFTKLAEDQSG